MARQALLIDGENISADCFPQIARLCVQLGLSSSYSAQVFADFRQGATAAWLDICRDFGLRPEFQLAIKGKNSVDIAMTIEVMDILAAGVADTICVVSSDRDFIPLAHRVRMAGVSMIGIGRAVADTSLMNACDRFLLLDEAGASNPPLPALAHLSDDERRFLVDLIDDLWRSSNSSPFHPGRVGDELKKRNAKLFGRFGGKNLLKRLAASKLVTVHETETVKLIAPSRSVA